MQRLEQVEVALVNQGGAHIGFGQGLAGMHPCKAAANDDHMRRMTQSLCWRFKLQKVMVACYLHPTRFLPKGMNCIFGWLF